MMQLKAPSPLPLSLKTQLTLSLPLFSFIIIELSNRSSDLNETLQKLFKQAQFLSKLNALVQQDLDQPLQSLSQRLQSLSSLSPDKAEQLYSQKLRLEQALVAQKFENQLLKSSLQEKPIKKCCFPQNKEDIFSIIKTIIINISDQTAEELAQKLCSRSLLHEKQLDIRIRCILYALYKDPEDHKPILDISTKLSHILFNRYLK